jgi:hypothetical protein
VESRFVDNLIAQRKPIRKYPGPIVLIVDALCYSAADIFAASFQDNEIGKIIGIDDRTGAGGASPWRYGELQKYANVVFSFDVPKPPQLPSNKEILKALQGLTHIDVERVTGPRKDLDSKKGQMWDALVGGETQYEVRYNPRVDRQRAFVTACGKNRLLQDLPGVDMEVSMRRAIRSGKREGRAIEDVGVSPDFFYQMKEKDILHKNVSLLRFAINRLKDMKPRGKEPPGDDGSGWSVKRRTSEPRPSKPSFTVPSRIEPLAAKPRQ